MKSVLVTAGLLASLAVVASAQARGDAAAGKARAEQCAECHGAEGEGDEAPKLAGRAESELLQAMREYRSGKRADASMKAVTEKLSEQDMANVAAYYASLK